MELSNIVGIWCAVMSTLQGIGAFYALADRRAKKELESEGNMAFKSNSLVTSILLFIGCAVTLVFMTWMFLSKPLRPTEKIVDRPVVVKEYVPCPPATEKTGPATARGGRDATAHSGHGDTFNAAPPQAPPANRPR